jgi:chemosensory pili system protein ChpB (putative protein-glutamate methylesterase)
MPELPEVDFAEVVFAEVEAPAPAMEALAVEFEAAPASTAYAGIAFTDDINDLHYDADAVTLEMPAPAFREAPQDFDALMRDLGGANDDAAQAAAVLDMPVDIALDSSVDLPMDLSMDMPADIVVDMPTVELPPVREFKPAEDLPSMDFDIAPPAAPTAKEVERAMPSFANLSLEALSDAPMATTRAVDAPVAVQFNKFDDKIASLSLVGSAGVDATHGAVVILAGIGGPDAVRQILTGLPSGFPRAVLISQRLDGGRYDRLVQQMGRAATLPVKLAEAGASLDAGTVYIVPPELGIDGGNGLRFAQGFSLLDALPAQDTAVLLLSGADASIVDAALAHAERGALVAGQSPDGCYDAAAPIALAARGGTAGAPQELVQSLLQRWPA